MATAEKNNLEINQKRPVLKNENLLISQAREHLVQPQSSAVNYTETIGTPRDIVIQQWKEDYDKLFKSHEILQNECQTLVELNVDYTRIIAEFQAVIERNNNFGASLQSIHNAFKLEENVELKAKINKFETFESELKILESDYKSLKEKMKKIENDREKLIERNNNFDNTVLPLNLEDVVINLRKKIEKLENELKLKESYSVSSKENMTKIEKDLEQLRAGEQRIFVTLEMDINKATTDEVIMKLNELMKIQKRYNAIKKPTSYLLKNHTPNIEEADSKELKDLLINSLVSEIERKHKQLDQALEMDYSNFMLLESSHQDGDNNIMDLNKDYLEIIKKLTAKCKDLQKGKKNDAVEQKNKELLMMQEITSLKTQLASYEKQMSELTVILVTVSQELGNKNKEIEEVREKEANLFKMCLSHKISAAVDDMHQIDSMKTELDLLATSKIKLENEIRHLTQQKLQLENKIRQNRRCIDCLLRQISSGTAMANARSILNDKNNVAFRISCSLSDNNTDDSMPALLVRQYPLLEATKYCLLCRQNATNDKRGCHIHCDTYKKVWSCCGNKFVKSEGCLKTRHLFIQLLDGNVSALTDGVQIIHLLS